MKVLWYWPHPHRTASPVVEAILGDGEEVVVQALPSLNGERFVGNESYRVVRDLPDPSLTVSRWFRPLHPLADAVRRVRARRALLREGFDVLHVETITYELDAIDLPRLARRVAVVAMVHDVLPHQSRWPLFVGMALHRRVYTSGAHLVVFHRVLAEQLVAQFGVIPSCVHVVPIPVPPPTAPGIREHPATLLFFGSLRANKGLEVLIEAIALGLPASVRVVIAGAGDDVLEAAVLACAAVNSQVVAEIGLVSLERKRELFAEATAVVLPYTTFAAQSGVLADAYAAQVPLIVSDVGALGPTVRDDGTGLVVPPNDATALTAAITELVASPTTRWELALAAAAARHSQAAVGLQLLEIYRIALADSADRRH